MYRRLFRDIWFCVIYLGCIEVIIYEISNLSLLTINSLYAKTI